MTEQLAVIEHEGPVIAHVGPVMPVASPAEMRQAMHLYQQTKEAILDPSDYQKADGRSFVKKSGWAKLAIAFGVSSEIVRRELERTEDGALTRAEFVVRATAPNGRFAEGWGSCAADEPRFNRASARHKMEHDLPATAETRARNRAYSALFGHGEVSYEEVDAGGNGGGTMSPRAALDKLAGELASRTGKTKENVLIAFAKDRGVTFSSIEALGDQDIAPMGKAIRSQLAIKANSESEDIDF